MPPGIGRYDPGRTTRRWGASDTGSPRSSSPGMASGSTASDNTRTGCSTRCAPPTSREPRSCVRSSSIFRAIRTARTFRTSTCSAPGFSLLPSPRRARVPVRSTCPRGPGGPTRGQGRTCSAGRRSRRKPRSTASSGEGQGGCAQVRLEAGEFAGSGSKLNGTILRQDIFLFRAMTRWMKSLITPR
jgi:hypothetical protein